MGLNFSDLQYLPKRVLYMNLETTRPRGRPRNRWLDEVREDGKMVGGEEWQEKVYDREEWKRLLRTARNHCILHMPMDWLIDYLQQKKVLLWSASSSSPNLRLISNVNATLTSFHSFINNLFNCRHVEGWIEPGISLYTSWTILHLDVKKTNIKGTQQEHKLLQKILKKNIFRGKYMHYIYLGK